DSDFVFIMARITDPPGYGNYIRFYTGIKDFPFYPAYNSVYDDQVTDGTTYNVQVPRGIDRNSITKQGTSNYILFPKGDTVTVKLCNIDKATYDFWRTMEYDYQSIGNPFSSPTTVIGNISNNGLGAFCGYAAQYVQIIIPK
ncbi:MAG TPA: DUF4249 family protein, partial [Puia sp.]|nr:DUF4249 family protein [Puia sp.]